MCIFFRSTAQNFVYGEQPGFEAMCDAHVTLGHCFWGNQSQHVTSCSQMQQWDCPPPLVWQNLVLPSRL
ncbi:uncharacterized protein LACBIDRAFT_307224 [Laccaria bicolor S238N-H82]|uniref:Predicted protein n=1 Tax=Laccaria bicolor (strain S238N-H82 / ATCC MYA-4686) TaxID=486041 RepID=B0DPP5_LACBS|nr:uncharacterized protein LACBIDRAFT_307224 [Laccaria bicolor S238N-H82]EDR03413.1 predicted protein [Laccaria bicolor S238N-H82]|eukprot:XP_001885869.1 predicted protein [Laccaria bicolor S238N-H82]